MSHLNQPILSTADAGAFGPGMTLALMALFTSSVVAALLLGYFFAFRQHMTPLRRRLNQQREGESDSTDPLILLPEQALAVLREISTNAADHQTKMDKQLKRVSEAFASDSNALRQEQREERTRLKAELKEAGSLHKAQIEALREQYTRERKDDQAAVKKFKDQVNSVLKDVSSHLRTVSEKSTATARSVEQSTQFQREVVRTIAEQREQLARLKAGIQYDLMSLAFAPVFDIYDELLNLKDGAAGQPNLLSLVASLERSLQNSFDALRLEPVRFEHGADPKADPDRIPAALWEPNPQAADTRDPALAGRVARQSATGFRIAAGPGDRENVRVLRRAIITLYRWIGDNQGQSAPRPDGAPGAEAQAASPAGQAGEAPDQAIHSVIPPAQSDRQP